MLSERQAARPSRPEPRSGGSLYCKDCNRSGVIDAYNRGTRSNEHSGARISRVQQKASVSSVSQDGGEGPSLLCAEFGNAMERCENLWRDVTERCDGTM